jgi:hypothetical protein
MLSLLRNLTGGKVLVGNQTIGAVGDLFFDNRDWTVRFILLRVGSWFRQKSILITPDQINSIEWMKTGAFITVNQDVIEKNPRIDQDRFALYQWPYYWTGAGVLGIASTSDISKWGITPDSKFKLIPKRSSLEKRKAINIQSVNGTLDYHIKTRDTDVGYLEDFIVSDEDWKIRYLVVDTQLLLPERLILLSSEWVQSISWDHLIVHFDIPEEQLINSPVYSPKSNITREYEERLWSHFQKPGYWKADILSRTKLRRVGPH